MSAIIISAKYFGYSVGGAEASMLALLKDAEASGRQIIVYKFEGVTTLGAANLECELPKSWKLVPLRLPYDWGRFYFLCYLLNRSYLKKTFSSIQMDGADLYSYGIISPSILNNYHGNTTYFIRDEMGLGWNINYARGWKRILKALYMLCDYPFYLIWKKDLLLAGKKARIVANSRFIADEAEKIWEKKISIVLPKVEVLNLEQTKKALKGVSRNRILMVGDNLIKGTNVFREIAKNFPDEEFAIVDRKFTKDVRIENITYLPWQKSTIDLYRHVKLVLIPSVVNEAYSRVARECHLLGIPVLGSSIGGIPEALEDDSDSLVSDYLNEKAWVERVKIKLTDISNAGV